MVTYNAGFVTSVTPEDGTDISSRSVSNAFLQSVALTRTMDFWGRAGGLSIVVPYAFANTSSSTFQASTNGVSDVAFLWQINIFGGPALTREQFRAFVPQTFSSFHLYIGTPLGTYNPTSPINPSANRWMVSPTINYSYTPDRGWTWIETYFTGQFFTDNDSFFVNGARTLAQNPIFRAEEHISRNLTGRLWLSADAYYNAGGETSIDGTPQWDCVCGAAAIWDSTTSASSPSPQASRILKPSASNFDNSGEPDVVMVRRFERATPNATSPFASETAYIQPTST
jgi:hypothetical protein